MSHLLPIFIFSDTLRSGITFWATQQGVYLPPATLACLSEVIKLAAALLLHYRWHRNKGSKSPTTPEQWHRALLPFSTSNGEIHWAICWSTALPAALYLLNNVLYLVSFRFVSPGGLAIALQAKLPLTAILHYIVMKRARCCAAWICLAVLSLAILNLHIPWTDLNFSMMQVDRAVSALQGGWQKGLVHWLGPLLGFVIAANSSVTSIATEILLKQPIPFWTLQVWLYLWGSILSVVLVLCNADGPLHPESLTGQAKTGFLAVLLSTAATGIIVANILRKSDNLVKLVGSAAVMVATVLLQPLLDPSLAEESRDPFTLLTIFVIGVSTYLYNVYKDRPTKSTAPVELPLFSPALVEARTFWGSDPSSPTFEEKKSIH